MGQTDTSMVTGTQPGVGRNWGLLGVPEITRLGQGLEGFLEEVLQSGRFN